MRVTERAINLRKRLPDRLRRPVPGLGGCLVGSTPTAPAHGSRRGLVIVARFAGFWGFRPRKGQSDVRKEQNPEPRT